MSVEAMLAEAKAHHAAGRAEQAGRGYRSVLARDPRSAEAAHLFGVLALQLGQPGPALELVDRALALRPATAAFHASRGDALLALGRAPDAEASLREALRLKPGAASVHAALGAALTAQGRTEDAVASLRRATRSDPSLVHAWNLLGAALRDLGRHGEAAEAFAASLRAAPGDPVVLFHLGASLAEDGRNAEAADVFEQVVARTPDDARAHLQLFRMLTRLGRDSSAARSELLRLAPDDPVMHNEVALALREAAGRGNAEERNGAALEHARAAVRLQPGDGALHENLASLLRSMGRHDEALAAFAEALRLQPDDPKARFGLALCHLGVGDFPAGWDLYESRIDVYAGWRFPHPVWTGEPLPGKTLLVHGEQGLGDAIMAARYVPLAAARAGRLVLQAAKPLTRLFANLPGVVEQFDETQDVGFDEYCPMMSLPRAFRTTLETIPTAPYLFADPVLAEAWRARVSALPGMRVGVAWAGNPGYMLDRERSAPFDALTPLWRTEGASFVSLQKNAPPEVPRPMLADWTAELADFADTAALIDALDLVIAVDTAVAHLAGALGKPVWLLNRFDSDWRWLRDRSDSPWYPSMRIFRQTRIGDWDGVIADAAKAFRVLSSSRT